jgi:hypothetical protein
MILPKTLLIDCTILGEAYQCAFYLDGAVIHIPGNVCQERLGFLLLPFPFYNALIGESALGTSPNAALRTVRERLRSYSSHYPTGDPRPNLQ